jgi:hypothetical protein
MTPFMNLKYVRYRLDALASFCPWLEVTDLGKYHELEDDKLVETEDYTFSLSVVSGGAKFTRGSQAFSLHNDRSAVDKLFLLTALGVTEMAIENSLLNIKEGR